MIPRHPTIIALILVGLFAPSISAQTVAGKSLHFENDILPLLARYGCNSSGCHGKAEGQNGFKLSVFGFDPDGDYSAIVKEAHGRRLFPAAPDQSLLLTKASGRVPHGGGTRILLNSPAYRVLRLDLGRHSDWRSGCAEGRACSRRADRTPFAFTRQTIVASVRALYQRPGS